MKDFRTEDGSSQGQNLALTGLCVLTLLDSGIVDRIVVPPIDLDAAPRLPLTITSVMSYLQP